MSSLPPHSKPQEAGELKNENERKETNERARGEQRTTAEGVEERSHDIHNYTEEGEFKRSKTRCDRVSIASENSAQREPNCI